MHSNAFAFVNKPGIQYYTFVNKPGIQYYTFVNKPGIQYYTFVNKPGIQYYTFVNKPGIQYYTYNTFVNKPGIQYYTYKLCILKCCCLIMDTSPCLESVQKDVRTEMAGFLVWCLVTRWSHCFNNFAKSCFWAESVHEDKAELNETLCYVVPA